MTNNANTLIATLAALNVPEFDSVAAASRYGKHPVVNKWFEWGETSDPSHEPLTISGAQEIALQDVIDSAITAAYQRGAEDMRNKCVKRVSLARLKWILRDKTIEAIENIEVSNE